MKKLAFWVLLLLGIPAHSQIINLLNEDFNNGFPAGWMNLDEDTCTPNAAVNAIGDAFSMHVDYDTLIGGDSILVATSWFSPSGQASNYLVLPALTLQANGNVFEFQVMSKDPSYPEAFEVLLSETTSALDSLQDTLYANETANPYWTSYQIDLDAYAGQTVFLAIHHASDDMFILGLDNFHVYADLTAGVGEQAKIEYRVFPNPSNDYVWISGNEGILQTRIFDLSGRMVFQESFNGQSGVNLNVQDLSAGSYLLHVDCASGTFCTRIVIQ
jgi:hypothetical protein